jgi:CHAT domain-containing protein
VTFASSPLASDALEKDLRALTAEDRTAFDNAARHLYSVLIGPVEASLRSATTLVIVPDGSLYRVPFAALSPDEDRYLSDTHRVLIATSATVYASTTPTAGWRGPPSALVVANPSVGDLGLPALPAAEREADAIKAIYPGATVLLRDGATPRRFVAALDSADLLHFAGHALVSEDFPWLSRLMLASENDPTKGEGFFVHEFEPGALKRLRLVVLAACSTGAGAIVRGEGVLNLARPFLLSGTPFVVVTAWDIADDVAAQFFSTFHASYRATSDPIESLSAAQRQMRRSSDARLRDPRSWSGYMLVGGLGASQPTQHTDREDN